MSLDVVDIWIESIRFPSGYGNPAGCPQGSFRVDWFSYSVSILYMIWSGCKVRGANQSISLWNSLREER